MELRKNKNGNIKPSNNAQLVRDMNLLKDDYSAAQVVTPLPKNQESKRKTEVTNLGLTEYTEQLHLRFHDPDMVEAIERRVYLSSTMSNKSDVVREIFSRRYDLEVNYTQKTPYKTPELKLTFLSTAVMLALEKERKKLGYSEREKNDFYEMILKEDLAPELACIKSGVPRGEEGPFLRSNSPDTDAMHELREKHEARRIYTKKASVIKILADMDPDVFIRNMKEIREFLEGLE